MCNPIIPLVSHGVFERRWFVFQAVETMTEHARLETAAVAGGGGGAAAAAGGGSIKSCICSPTRHAGSFRCRYHHGDYEWGRRITKK
ncbi:hypothetical protein JCGZ_07229 [Jatropha curcas]|uniref:Uncharacterized protein n=1 Tax=Jatropha curcas TaxID=180498 RepID=A0A067KF95_JATCU|nr:hypothetical protein JCGZ_07229 [Jatropha curcas]